MNQLFKEKPTLEMVDKVLYLFGIINFNENYRFTRDDLKNKAVVTKITDVGLEHFYIKCKYQKYFSNLDEKKVITILRQLVRLYGYKVNSIEKFSNSQKYLVYHLAKLSEPEDIDIENKVVVKFD